MKLTNKQKAKDAARMLRGEDHFFDFVILELLAPRTLVYDELRNALAERACVPRDDRGPALMAFLNSAGDAVNRLQRQGLIRKRGEGRYQITEAGRAALAAEDKP